MCARGSLTYPPPLVPAGDQLLISHLRNYRAIISLVRRAVIYFVLAAVCGLVGGVGLSGELGAEATNVDGLIVDTHTERIRGASGGRTTVYYVDVERQDTFEQVSVRNAPFYDAYEANKDPRVVLEIRDLGDGVEQISAAHYLGKTYEGTTKTEGVSVAIAFFLLAALFLGLGIRRVIVVRRKRATPVTPPWPAPQAP